MALDEVLVQIKNKKMVLGVTLALAGVLTANHMIVKPLIMQVKAVEADKIEITKKSPTALAIVQLESQMEKYKNVFAKTKENAQIIEELNALASSSGLAIQSIVPEAPAKIGSNVERLSVRVDAEGNYHQVGSFVSKIESLKYFVKIARVEIDSNTREAGGVGRSGRSGVDSYRVGLTVNLLYPSRETAV